MMTISADGSGPHTIDHRFAGSEEPDRFRRVVRFSLSPGERPIEVELLSCGHVDSARRRLDIVRWRLFAPDGSPGRRAALHIEILGESDGEPVIVADSRLEELLQVVPNFPLDGDPDFAWESIAGTRVPAEFTSLLIAVVR